MFAYIWMKIPIVSRESKLYKPGLMITINLYNLFTRMIHLVCYLGWHISKSPWRNLVLVCSSLGSTRYASVFLAIYHFHSFLNLISFFWPLTQCPIFCFIFFQRDSSSFFFNFSAEHAAYGSSQARGRSGATAAGLYHSYSNMGSKSHLRPLPQLTATLNP